MYVEESKFFFFFSPCIYISRSGIVVYFCKNPTVSLIYRKKNLYRYYIYARIQGEGKRESEKFIHSAGRFFPCVSAYCRPYIENWWVLFVSAHLYVYYLYHPSGYTKDNIINPRNCYVPNRFLLYSRCFFIGCFIFIFQMNISCFLRGPPKNRKKIAKIFLFYLFFLGTIIAIIIIVFKFGSINFPGGGSGAI